MNALLPLTAVCVTATLLLPRIRRSRGWRATVTPLASIIGSGFLVVVPLLGHLVGFYAPIAMLSVLVTAWLLGDAVRFNIRHAEPLLASSTEPSAPTARRIERVSDASLGFAYLLSVTFYLRLLAAFALSPLAGEHHLAEDTLCSALLILIGVGGYLRGLDWLERLEEYAVSTKLGVIAALIVGWTVHDLGAMSAVSWSQLRPRPMPPMDLARTLGGVLIVVQGFETSRYLGQRYDAALRIRSMRHAQWVSALVYLLFVTITIPSYPDLPHQVDETALVGLSRHIAPVLPPMLVLAALASQFSAAVADSVGAAGLFAQTVGTRLGLRERHGYLLVAATGVMLVWATDIFHIIAFASRAFALYYAVQCTLAAWIAWRGPRSARSHPAAARFAALTLLMVWVVVFAESAD